MNDREQMLVWQQGEQAEAQALNQALHYEALGVGMAVFCQAMYDTLVMCDAGKPSRFTRAEILALIVAAVQGR